VTVEASAADASSSVPAGPRCVLVVEDEEAIRDVLADIFEERGFRVFLAANGAEALLQLESARPDVMVLDLLMPVMHGWSFMESYLEKTGGALVPIVIVSVNPALPRSFNRFGVREVISKPFNVEALVAAVERAAEPVAI
jgi:two-component system chemotaxis response regulator CheY